MFQRAVEQARHICFNKEQWPVAWPATVPGIEFPPGSTPSLHSEARKRTLEPLELHMVVSPRYRFWEPNSSPLQEPQAVLTLSHLTWSRVLQVLKDGTGSMAYGRGGAGRAFTATKDRSWVFIVLMTRP